MATRKIYGSPTKTSSNVGYYTPPKTAYDQASKPSTGYTGGGSYWDYMIGQGKATAPTPKPSTGVPGAFEQGYMDTGNPYPSYPGGGSGGRGGGGGGGGGGGIKPLSQEAYNAMLAAIKRKGSPYDYDFQEWNPAAYQGMEVRPFDDSIYRQAEQALMQGYDRAGQQIAQGTANVNRGLQDNWANYQALMNLVPQTATPRGTGLTSSLGGDQRVASEAARNAAAQDAAFGNMFQMANLRAQQGQDSRMNEAALADQFYRNQLETQRLADQTGLSLAEARALQEWQRYADERAYADNMLAQQWDREASQYNNQGQNTVGRDIASTNFAADQAYNQNTLGPLLELIQLANQGGLNINLAELGL